MIAAHEPVEVLCHDAAVRASAQDALEAHGVPADRVRLHVVPTDRVWLRDSAPDRRARRSGSRGARELGVQRLGEIRQLRAGPGRRRGDGPHHRPAAASSRRGPTPAHGSCSRAAASRSTGEGVVLVTEEWLLSDTQVRNPGLGRRGLRGGVRDLAGRAAHDLAGRRLRRRRHARARGRHRAVRQPGHRGAGRRSPTPPTRTTRAQSTTSGACELASGQPGVGPAAHRRAAVSPRRHDARRAPAGQLRELLHRQRLRDRADVQRRQRPRRAGHAGGADARRVRSSASMPSIWSGASGRLHCLTQQEPRARRFVVRRRSSWNCEFPPTTNHELPTSQLAFAPGMSTPAISWYFTSKRFVPSTIRSISADRRTAEARVEQDVVLAS